MSHEPMPAQGQVDVNVMPHTPGPWKLGEFDENLGYDCMTGGIRSGPAVLDGSDYGQKRCAEIAPAVKARMLADAALISAAPDLLAALIEMEREKSDYMQRNNLGDPARETTNKMARAAIAAALRNNVLGKWRAARGTSSDRRERF